ncbi:MAG: hypothetical protein NWQ54_16400 [Paraglaciecola sp.]|nr:hypothetical protein [Paraglaciecola sp.]
MTPSLKLHLVCFLLAASFVSTVQANHGQASSPQQSSAPYRKPLAHQFRIHGLNRFSGPQKELLREWLKMGVGYTRNTLGVYPRRLELYVYPRPSNQPVPWAHTRRDAQESIHFYVDTRFDLTDFINDWTIYHELAHLSIPYVGESYAWFSEGFASYMQYQIMAQNKVLKDSLKQAYSNKIAPHLSLFDVIDTPANVASKLMDNRNFPAAYWGGAYFFVLAEHQLRAKHQLTLVELIANYQTAGRLTDDSVHALVRSWDELINDTLFVDLLNRFTQDPARDIYPAHFN